MPKIGDYVLATKYSDADPGDGWAVGFINKIENDRFFVGDDKTISFRFSGYRYCAIINAEVGKWLLQSANYLESSPPGCVNMFAMLGIELFSAEGSNAIKVEHYWRSGNDFIHNPAEG